MKTHIVKEKIYGETITHCIVYEPELQNSYACYILLKQKLKLEKLKSLKRRFHIKKSKTETFSKDTILKGYITKEKASHGKIYHNIVNAPIVQNSYANYVMMKREYEASEIKILKFSKKDRNQSMFNMEYLITKEKELGLLICGYCGKGLTIFPFAKEKTKGEREYMATVDHFYPKCNYNNPRDLDNLVIACYPHNSSKQDYVYSLDSLKFYDGPLKHKDLTINIIDKNKSKHKRI